MLKQRELFLRQQKEQNLKNKANGFYERELACLFGLLNLNPPEIEKLSSAPLSKFLIVSDDFLSFYEAIKTLPQKTDHQLLCAFSEGFVLKYDKGRCSEV